jgi:predicted HicB family RNase H-like nuclease
MPAYPPFATGGFVAWEASRSRRFELSDRRKELTKQIVVRVDEGLYEALARDAEMNGRTVAQSVRFKLGELRTAV